MGAYGHWLTTVLVSLFRPTTLAVLIQWWNNAKAIQKKFLVSRPRITAFEICKSYLYLVPSMQIFSKHHFQPTNFLNFLNHGGLLTPACNIQIDEHQSITLLQDGFENICVCVHVNLCEIMAILWSPRVIWLKLSGALFPFWPPVKNFDEDPEEKTLIACTYCVNNGTVLETLPSSNLLLFQSYMQAVFHLSLPSPSVACNFWDRQPAPPPLLAAGGSTLSTRAVLMTLTAHSH